MCNHSQPNKDKTDIKQITFGSELHPQGFLGFQNDSRAGKWEDNGNVVADLRYFY